MGDLTGIVIAAAVGLPILIVAVLVDRHRHRARDLQAAAAPLRGSEAVDASVPDYVSQGRIDALSSPGATVVESGDFSGGTTLAFGHMDVDFATAAAVAQYEDAAVLMINDDVSSMRELLIPLAMAAAGRPLVIAASSFHREVLDSLKANRKMMSLAVVAVEANLAQLMQLQDEVGGELLSASDLKAGWLPRTALGEVSRWRSDMRSIHVQRSSVDKG